MSEERPRARWATVTRAVPGLALFDGYSKHKLRIDLLAALSLWAVVVPQALAYGELAGLAPVAGLYTALAGMLLYALFGSSRYLNVGPESSVAIVVAASIGPLAAGDATRAAELTAMLAILTGAFLVVGSLLRLGFITRLLSTPILAGYLAGAAIIIAVSQVPKIFGISVNEEQWWAKITGVAKNLSDVNWWTFGIGIATIVLVVALQRFAPRLPAYLIALALATLVTALAHLAARHGVPITGQVERGVPIPSWPRVGLHGITSLLGPAASVALLVFASSIATVSALAGRDRDDFDPTREFLGLAAAGIGAGFLHGFPANGSDSRSFIVAGSGARSQVANVFGAGTVLVTLMFLTPLFRNLPTAALGAVVLVAVVKLIDVAQFRRLWRVRKSDFVLGLITFAGVLIFGVLPGIEIGVAVSLLETLRRAILPHTAVLGLVAGTPTYRDVEHYENAEAAPGLVVYRFDAPLFFANAEVLRTEVRKLVRNAPHRVRQVVLSAEGITDMDITGAEVLSRLLDDLEDLGVRFTMARARTSLIETLRRLGLEERIGDGNFFMTVLDATKDFGQGPDRGRSEDS